MASRDLILGLSICDRSVQAVELEQDGPSNTLLAIDEWDNTFPLGAEDDPQGMEQFVEHVSAFIKVNRVKARRVSVALDTSSLFINSFPLEEGASRLDLNEHVSWELSQFFPDLPPREFVTDVHIMSTNPAERWKRILSVSVRRSNAYAVQSAMAKLGLTLHVLDVDHFSADTALRANYPDAERKYLALVGVKENRLDISLLRNGSLQSYTYSVVQSNQEIIDEIGEVSREVRGITSLSVYGPHLDKDLLVLIRRGSSLLVEALNPLRHLHVADSVRLADHLAVPFYRFAAAVGVALRRE